MKLEGILSEKLDNIDNCRDAEFVDDIIKFEGAQAALIAINGLLRELSKSQSWTTDLEAVVEEHTDVLASKLTETAWEILDQKAMTPHQLELKAAVLKFYCDESPNDLTSALVTSICGDIMSRNIYQVCKPKSVSKRHMSS